MGGSRSRESESDCQGEPEPEAGSGWVVYVLVSADRRRTYVGITTDPERRLAQHNGRAPGGARATRAGRPWRIGAQHGPYADRGDALRLEARLKRRRGRARLAADATAEAPGDEVWGAPS